MKIKIAFLGTPDFAVPSLLALHEAGYEICGVFTQPDRPGGRGNTLRMSAVKQCALRLGIPVFQPARISARYGVEMLQEVKPDLMITAAFGQILSAEVLALPRLGCINVHGSLLPAYRGASPIQMAIINGEKKTGITTMLTDAGLDTGDMLLKCETDILPDETASQLFDRLAPMGAKLLLRTVEGYLKGEITPQKQDENGASYYKMIKKTDAELDFNKTAEELVNFVRGMNSWPVAYVNLAEGVLKVYTASAADGKAPVGMVSEDLVFGCAKGVLRAETVQMAGTRVMTAKEFLRGHKVMSQTVKGAEK